MRSSFKRFLGKHLRLLYQVIYPQRTHESTMNQQVLAQMEKRGDSLSKAREVVHWIYFKTESGRNKFEAELIGKGFIVKAKDFDKGYGNFPFKLVIWREDKVGWNEIDNYTLELWELANQYDGDYDGWEAAIFGDK